MPKRTEEERKLIDSLPTKLPAKTCNARTPRGDYCRNVAGFRTPHLGDGRCYLHGGLAGRPPEHGFYSMKLKGKFKEDYDNAINDRSSVNLYSELAVMKSILGSIIEDISQRIEDGENVWIAENKSGESVISAKAKLLLRALESLRRIYSSIVDAQTRRSVVLTMEDAHKVAQSILNTMRESCGGCPVMKSLGSRLRDGINAQMK